MSVSWSHTPQNSPSPLRARGVQVFWSLATWTPCLMPAINTAQPTVSILALLCVGEWTQVWSSNTATTWKVRSSGQNLSTHPFKLGGKVGIKKWEQSRKPNFGPNPCLHLLYLTTKVKLIFTPKLFSIWLRTLRRGDVIHHHLQIPQQAARWVIKEEYSLPYT